MKAARSFDTPGITKSVIPRSNPEDLNPPADSNVSSEDSPCILNNANFK
jgi:hypothetical protein